jgi:acyl carrier protein
VGLDWLNMTFRLEKRFQIKIKPGEYGVLARRKNREDFTVGELHAFVCRKIKRTGRSVPTDSFEQLKDVLVDTLAVDREEVKPETWFREELRPE